MKFNPCADKCTYEGTHCEGCGRSHEEIAETKKMVMALVNFAQTQGYENVDEFANAIGQSIAKKLKKSAAGK
ncbi:MAG: DUF1289 domain-containing protein [Methylobacter sp.]|jgi:predicted Fe-S protein YdhL (DUF1289 family)|nr:DUF1289 domain-containing protein [Methylobacter sp.]